MTKAKKVPCIGYKMHFPNCIALNELLLPLLIYYTENSKCHCAAARAIAVMQ
jgi:hypothetical protein